MICNSLLTPRVFASAQNELTTLATSKTLFPMNACGSRKKRRYYQTRDRATRLDQAEARVSLWERLYQTPRHSAKA
jgi:hypothetical protein